MRPLAALAMTAILCSGCADSSSVSVCPDDGDPAGPACTTRMDSAEDFQLLTLEAGYLPHSDRITKYMAPAGDEPDLLPTVFQNMNRYPYHVDFLKTVFGERFPELDTGTYLNLILLRETRQYFSGNLLRIDDPVEGELYGFTVYTAASSEELLEVHEVRAIHRMLDEVFSLGTLAYTFDPSDSMARQKAQAWNDPGFPIYFY